MFLFLVFHYTYIPTGPWEKICSESPGLGFIAAHRLPRRTPCCVSHESYTYPDKHSWLVNCPIYGRIYTISPSVSWQQYYCQARIKPWEHLKPTCSKQPRWNQQPDYPVAIGSIHVGARFGEILWHDAHRIIKSYTVLALKYMAIRTYHIYIYCIFMYIYIYMYRCIYTYI